MTKTRTARAPQAEQVATAESIADRVKQEIAASEEFREVELELVRLHTEQASSRSSLDQVRAASSDVDSLVDRIESGEELRPSDSADRIRVLEDLSRAYSLAIQRAERRKRDVLGSIGRGCDDLAAEHIERLKSMAATMRSMEAQVRQMAEIPATMQRFGVSPDNRFPIPHHNDLQAIRPRLKHFLSGYDLFLNGGGK